MVLKNLKFGKTHTVTGQVTAPGAIASGLGWYVVREGQQHVLHYLTGENPEREDQIVLTEAELEALVAAGGDGDAVVTRIANERYNARHGLV